jgi:DNA-directed RNA polymerase specialized sigma24 family protein
VRQTAGTGAPTRREPSVVGGYDRAVSEASPPVTQLLASAAAGDAAASAQLSSVLYTELRRLAQQHLRGERTAESVRPTALVNEAYLRLVAQQPVDWQDRAEFYAVASALMRRLVVEHADATGQSAPAREVVAVDAALARLAAIDAQQAKIVELRYFAGLTADETADVLGVPAATVASDWAMARAWLRCELAQPATPA